MSLPISCIPFSESLDSINYIFYQTRIFQPSFSEFFMSHSLYPLLVGRTTITCVFELHILFHKSMKLCSFWFANSFICSLDWKSSIALSPSLLTASFVRCILPLSSISTHLFQHTACFHSWFSIWHLFIVSLFLMKHLTFLFSERIFSFLLLRIVQIRSCLLISIYVHCEIGFHWLSILMRMG